MEGKGRGQAQPCPQPRGQVSMAIKVGAHYWTNESTCCAAWAADLSSE
jgi:hypothetical protein